MFNEVQGARQKMIMGHVDRRIDTVLFDFGGVIAEEGFREGLKAIARLAGIHEEIFFQQAEELIYSSGYVLGNAPESVFWQSLRELTGITYPNEFLRNKLLSRFIIRPRMIGIIKKIKAEKFRVGILSDQTDWLDRINERYDFFKYFDVVYNSFYLGKGKRDASLFEDVAKHLGVQPDEILFIDDNPGHCERAKQKKLNVIYYVDMDAFRIDMSKYFPDVN